MGRKVHNRMSSEIYGAHNLFHFHIVILTVSGNTEVYIDLGF